MSLPSRCILTSLYRLDEREDGEELQKYLQEKTGQRSVPNIFISMYNDYTFTSNSISDARLTPPSLFRAAAYWW
jgi:hypothetical protein